MFIVCYWYNDDTTVYIYYHKSLFIMHDYNVDFFHHHHDAMMRVVCSMSDIIIIF